jgi:hypothetical protein
MRLDRGLPKGREGLTEREQQPHTSMGGSPGRLTGQRHQARYHLVVKDGMYISPCKLNFCAQISLASLVDAVACSNVSMCMPSVCATAFSEPQLLCFICIRWLPYQLNGAYQLSTGHISSMGYVTSMGHPTSSTICQGPDREEQDLYCQPTNHAGTRLLLIDWFEPVPAFALASAR